MPIVRFAAAAAAAAAIQLCVQAAMLVGSISMFRLDRPSDLSILLQHKHVAGSSLHVVGMPSTAGTYSLDGLAFMCLVYCL